jgi:RimJ/RimL family protein N-acetyltransferase
MLLGEHVCLGPVLASDRAPLFAWFNDAGQARMHGSYRPMDETGFEQWFAGAGRDPARVVFSIRQKSDLRLLGCVEISEINSVARTANVGVTIGAEADRDHGFGHEAIELAIGYSWRDLNLQRLSLAVVGDNPRAVRAYERVGFELEGTMRRAAYIGGAFQDITIMGLLRSEAPGDS